MYKNPVKARFIIASPKCFIKPFDRTITSMFRLVFRQIQINIDKCRFLGSTEQQPSKECN